MSALDELLKLDLAVEPVPMEEPEYHELARQATTELAALRARVAAADKLAEAMRPFADTGWIVSEPDCLAARAALSAYEATK